MLATSHSLCHAVSAQQPFPSPVFAQKNRGFQRQPAVQPSRWSLLTAPRPALSQRRCETGVCKAAADDEAEEPSASGMDNIEKERARLSKMMATPTINGTELRELIKKKWNRQYDCRLTKRGKSVYFQVFWKWLGQKSFPLTEEEYQMQLDAVAEYLTMWGVSDVVRSGIAAAKWSPGLTIGGGARAYTINLGVDVGSGRSGEWNSF